jgi:hypothetical protein
MSFVLGALASSVWNAHRPVSLCDIDANPGRYAGKIVRLRVIVSNDIATTGVLAGSRYISACSLCAATGDWPAAALDLDPQQVGLLSETKLDVLGKMTGKSHLTEAIIVGRFEPPDRMRHCFGPKYNISNARIERVIANHEFENNEQAAQWLKSKSR